MKAKVILIALILMILANLTSVSAAEPLAVPNSLTLQKGTVIKVQAIETSNSRTIKRNDKVHFRVLESLVMGDVVIIPSNTVVEAVAKKVTKAGPWDRDGEIEVVFSEIKTKEGYVFPVTGSLMLRGDKPNILVRYSLIGFLLRGKEVVIKAGAEVNLQIKEDVVIYRDTGI